MNVRRPMLHILAAGALAVLGLSAAEAATPAPAPAPCIAFIDPLPSGPN